MPNNRSAATPEVSVILCTYNPRTDYLAMALRSIGAQSLGSHRFELVVVDNNSQPALEPAPLERIAGVPVRVVKQPLQGLTHARVAGIGGTDAPLVVFVDDDNELALDYLERAVEIAEARPEVGVFGGITQGMLEQRVSGWKRCFLPQLGVRNHGLERIEGQGSHWGEWEPIGAGMVVRRIVADAFVRFLAEHCDAGSLGRQGAALMSGEDSLFSRLAHSLGLNGAYEPSLSLRHYISESRLTARYLRRLSYGHGRSFVLLARLTGDDEVLEFPASPLRHIVGNFQHRFASESLVGALSGYYWDRGFLDAVREIKSAAT